MLLRGERIRIEITLSKVLVSIETQLETVKLCRRGRESNIIWVDIKDSDTPNFAPRC